MDKDFCIRTSAIWQFVGYGIIVIKIVLPIIIIIIGVIELSKCVISGKDDEIKGVLKNLLLKIVMAIAIFFIPTVVRLGFSIVSDSETKTYASACFDCLLTPLKEDCKYAVDVAKEARDKRNNELYNKYYEGLGKDRKQTVHHDNEKIEGNPTENLDEEEEY